MIRHLGLGLGDVNALGDRRSRDVIDVEIEPWVAKRLSHDARF